MRRIHVLMLAGLATAVFLGSCSGIAGVGLNDAGLALGAAAGKLAFAMGDDNGAGMISRGPASGTYIYGDSGGSAWFDYEATESPYAGTVIFDGFTLELPDGDDFYVDGVIDLVVTGAENSWTAAFDGTITVGKNEIEPKVFIIDMDYAISLEQVDNILTVTVLANGTVNGSAIDQEYVFTIAFKIEAK